MTVTLSDRPEWTTLPFTINHKTQLATSPATHLHCSAGLPQPTYSWAPPFPSGF